MLMDTNKCRLYVKEECLPRTKMWVMGHKNVPYVGQDINVATKSYHSRLEVICRNSRRKTYKYHVVWKIYELTKDVLSHYWYQPFERHMGLCIARSMNCS